jgi:hypothetical protein
MTKIEMLDILELLSALESWSFATGKPIPDYLLESFLTATDSLRSYILKDGSPSA